MCAIAGILNAVSFDPKYPLRSMIGVMQHRGPDDRDVWTDGPVGLGHARLAILDRSNAGHQPMTSASGRYILTYNGEIYNYQELGRELEEKGVRFRGQSDTEVLLEAIAQWGLLEAVKKCHGMFAFGLWDREKQELSLVRDRLGIKPLYYGWAGEALVFASELKGIRAVPSFNSEVDRSALAQYMRLGYIPAPLTIYTNARKLMPGTILTVNADTARSSESAYAREVHYWQLNGPAEWFWIPGETEADRLNILLHRAMGAHMQADVPLGAFLSGGIDSSTVVSIMQRQSTQPIKTFTIGFDDPDLNEAVYAKAVAAHLGTDHTELYVSGEDALAVIPKLPAMYDEPFGDSSQIPTFLLCQLAKQSVTVCLSGDGGDELFAGYPSYFRARKLWSIMRYIPRWMRQAAGPLIRALPRDKMDKLAVCVAAEGPEALFRELISVWHRPSEIVKDGVEPWDVYTHSSLDDFTQRMLYRDTTQYLPDDILTKMDRASMAVSLEARVPLLDHRVVEFAWSLPMSMKIRTEGQGKWLLRQVLDQYVPRHLIDRPKRGLSVPLAAWLRGPLKDWAQELLGEDRLEHEGYLYPDPIRQKWHEHLSGKRNHQYALWNVLMFQAWLEHEHKYEAPRPTYTMEQHAETRYDKTLQWVCRGCLGKPLCQWERVKP